MEKNHIVKNFTLPIVEYSSREDKTPYLQSQKEDLQSRQTLCFCCRCFLARVQGTEEIHNGEATLDLAGCSHSKFDFKHFPQGSVRFS